MLDLPAEARSLAEEKDFEIKAYGIGAAQEQTRPPRLVKIAVVQNAIVRPTSDPVKDQVLCNIDSVSAYMILCISYSFAVAIQNCRRSCCSPCISTVCIVALL